MTPNQARDVIYAKIIADWPGVSSSVPAYFANESYDPTGAAEYLLTTVRNEFTEGPTLAPAGARIFDRRGLVVMQIYAAVDVGLLRLDALMKAARDLFEGTTLSGVLFFVADVQETGPVDGRFLGTVSVPFSYDEIR